MKDLDQPSVMLALLFAYAKPLTTRQLAQASGLNATETVAALRDLKVRLETSGLQLLEQSGSFHLATHPQAAKFIAKLPGMNEPSLTPAALETLAIVAYRQPVSRHDIDGLRGVSSDVMISHLLEEGLIETSGTAATPDHSPLYQTSMRFLELSGLDNLKNLPPVEDNDEA